MALSVLDELLATRDVIEAMAIDRMLIESVERAAAACADAVKAGGKIMFCGNGGSAADAQHLAAELVGKLRKDRAPIAAIALTADTSALTAIGNDYGFEHVFARQVRAIGNTRDVLVGISTSWKSANVLRAMHTADELGIWTVAMCGADGAGADHVIAVPSTDTQKIQEAHIVLGHILCAIIEERVCAS